MLPQLEAGQFEEVSIDEGQILRIAPDGQMIYGQFRYLSHSYLSRSYNWWEVHETSGIDLIATAEQFQKDYVFNEMLCIRSRAG